MGYIGDGNDQYHITAVYKVLDIINYPVNMPWNLFYICLHPNHTESSTYFITYETKI